jgi:hypothetical protein
MYFLISLVGVILTTCSSLLELGFSCFSYLGFLRAIILLLDLRESYDMYIYFILSISMNCLAIQNL